MFTRKEIPSNNDSDILYVESFDELKMRNNGIVVKSGYDINQGLPNIYKLVMIAIVVFMTIITAILLAITVNASTKKIIFSIHASNIQLASYVVCMLIFIILGFKITHLGTYFIDFQDSQVNDKTYKNIPINLFHELTNKESELSEKLICINDTVLHRVYDNTFNKKDTIEFIKNSKGLGISKLPIVLGDLSATEDQDPEYRKSIQLKFFCISKLDIQNINNLKIPNKHISNNALFLIHCLGIQPLSKIINIRSDLLKDSELDNIVTFASSLSKAVAEFPSDNHPYSKLIIDFTEDIQNFVSVIEDLKVPLKESNIIFFLENRILGFYKQVINISKVSTTWRELINQEIFFNEYKSEALYKLYSMLNRVAYYANKILDSALYYKKLVQSLMNKKHN